jgi:hypothetical protein
MPVTRSRNGVYETDLDGTNVTRFLFGEESSGGMAGGNAMDDRFPTLVRRDDQMVSCIFPSLCYSPTAFPLPLSPLALRCLARCS